MPVACISAYAVVGPTKRNPRRRSSFAIAVDSGVIAATSPTPRGRGRAGGANDHNRSGSRRLESRDGSGVRDRRVDLAAVAHDPGVVEQPQDVGVGELRDGDRVEGGEGRPERRTFAEDRQPGQAGLEGFEAEPLEQTVLVSNRPAPLLIVVVPIERVGQAPGAAGETVVPDDEAAGRLLAHRVGPTSVDARSGAESCSMGSSESSGRRAVERGAGGGRFRGRLRRRARDHRPLQWWPPGQLDPQPSDQVVDLVHRVTTQCLAESHLRQVVRGELTGRHLRSGTVRRDLRHGTAATDDKGDRRTDDRHDHRDPEPRHGRDRIGGAPTPTSAGRAGGTPGPAVARVGLDGVVTAPTLLLGERSFPPGRFAVMAIVNRTPDSFFDAGCDVRPRRGARPARPVVAEGADIVDVGGVKAGTATRSAEEELDRHGSSWRWPATDTRASCSRRHLALGGRDRAVRRRAPTWSTTPGRGTTRRSPRSPLSTASAWSARTPAGCRHARTRTGCTTTT